MMPPSQRTSKHYGYRKTFAYIDTKALIHNFNFLKSLLGDSQFLCPMIKSNGYGHGDIKVAEVLSPWGLEAVGVALLEEAIRLRESGFLSEILVFGHFSADNLNEYLQFQLTPVISSEEELDSLNNSWKVDLSTPVFFEKTQTSGPFSEQIQSSDRESVPARELSVHLKFNTGMNRRGLPLELAERAILTLESLEGIHLKGLCTHLACAEDYEDPQGMTFQQIQKFLQLKPYFQSVPHQHVLNSVALLGKNNSKNENCEWLQGWGARPGLALYGVASETTFLASNRKIYSQLKPVMELKSEIISVNFVKKGEAVSYGAHWVAPRDSVISVIPVGYGDGYSRTLSGRAQALYRGQRVPVVGIVCMDYVLLDLTEVLVNSVAHVGEEVVLFGRQGDEEIRVEELATWGKTISYEILVGIGRRVLRKYI